MSIELKLGDYCQPSALYASATFTNIRWTVPELKAGEVHRITGTIQHAVMPRQAAEDFFKRFGDARQPQDLKLATGSDSLTFRKFLLTQIGPQVASGDLVICTDIQFVVALWYFGETPPELAEQDAHDRGGIRAEAEIVEALTKRVFVTIGGQTLPSQSDVSGPYIPFVYDHPNARPKYAINNLGQLPDPLVPVWPRHSYCEVGCSGSVGTIDELVDLYRTQLEKAARQLVMYRVMPFEDHAKSIEHAKVHGYDPAAGKAVSFEPSKLGDAKTADWLRKSTLIMQTIMDPARPATDSLPHQANKKFADLMREYEPGIAYPIQMIYPNGKPAYLVARESEDQLKYLASQLPYDIDGIEIHYQLLPKPVDQMEILNQPLAYQMLESPPTKLMEEFVPFMRGRSFSRIEADWLGAVVKQSTGR